MAINEQIRQYAFKIGVDDVGFARVEDYHSPRSPKIETIFPEAKSIIVLAFQEMTNCQSPNVQIAMNGRFELMELIRSCNYKLWRYLERQWGSRAMTIPVSYPMGMSNETMGAVADFSLRHAAVAAGLGQFGRHNLVVHPTLGSRVIFSAILLDLVLPPSPPAEDSLCMDCNLCIGTCPAQALEESGKTDVIKCLRKSQPYGIGRSIGFWHQFVDCSPKEQKKMFLDEQYFRIYQAGSMGFQYYCFQCIASCPVGMKPGIRG